MDQLSAETFVAVGHQMIRNLGTPMAIIAAVAAATISAAVWARPDGPPIGQVVAPGRGVAGDRSV
jgi:hypothetical protein